MASCDKAEIAASVHRSPQKQPSLEPAIEDTKVQASLGTVPDTSDETTHEQETLSTTQISGALFDYYLSIELDIIHSEYYWAQKVGTDDSKRL
jgi:hypothetical protein